MKYKDQMKIIETFEIEIHDSETENLIKSENDEFFGYVEKLRHLCSLDHVEYYNILTSFMNENGFEAKITLSEMVNSDYSTEFQYIK